MNQKCEEKYRFKVIDARLKAHWEAITKIEGRFFALMVTAVSTLAAAIATLVSAVISK